MSDSQPPTCSGPPLPPPHQRDGCLTALAIAIGLVMLLPGACALLIVGLDPREALRDPNTVLACLGFLAIAAGGIVLIRWGVKQQR